MEPGGDFQMPLNFEERHLIIELLERERGDLVTEIHHTRTTAVRDDLRRRKELVEQLLDRVVHTEAA